MPFSALRARRYGERLKQAAGATEKRPTSFIGRVKHSAKQVAPAGGHMAIDMYRAGVVHRRITEPSKRRYAEKQLRKKEKKMREDIDEGVLAAIGAATRAARAATVPLRRSKIYTKFRLGRGKTIRTAKRAATWSQKTAPRRFGAEVARNAAIQTGTEIGTHAIGMRAKKAMDPQYRQNLDDLARQERLRRQNTRGGVRRSYEEIFEATKKKAQKSSYSHPHFKHNAHMALFRSQDMLSLRKRMAARPLEKNFTLPSRQRTNTRKEDIAVDITPIMETAARIYEGLVKSTVKTATAVALPGASLAGKLGDRAVGKGMRKIAARSEGVDEVAPLAAVAPLVTRAALGTAAKAVGKEVAVGVAANKITKRITKSST